MTTTQGSLAHVVNEILLSGQLDEGRIQLESEPVDALELSRAAVARTRRRAPGATVELVAPGPLPPVRADSAKLRQVLDNLLENAVKYSPDDPRIELRIEADDHRVRFAIHDHGLGIPNVELRRIFGKFYRLDPQLTRGAGGTGLYICRELVHRMGGRISVWSRFGYGSTFTVDLPAASIVEAVSPLRAG